MLGGGKVEPLIEDPTKREKRMLDIVERVVVKECCKQLASIPLFYKVCASSTVTVISMFVFMFLTLNSKRLMVFV